MDEVKLTEALSLMGLPAKDKVTGFTGVLTSISFDLYGCIQYVITPKAENGKVLEGHWMDADRIELLDEARVMDVPDFTFNYILDYTKGPADKPIK